MLRGFHCLAAFLLVLAPELICAFSVEPLRVGYEIDAVGVTSRHLRSKDGYDDYDYYESLGATNTYDYYESLGATNSYDYYESLGASSGSLDIMRINCPFTRTAINEGVMEKKTVYTFKEIEQLINDTGLASFGPRFISILKNDNIAPKEQMDLFDMEGTREEHTVSTGIYDCDSDYSNQSACTDDPVTGAKKCPTADPECFKTDPSRLRRKFDEFWAAVDVSPRDGILTKSELSTIDAKYRGNCLVTEKCTNHDNFDEGAGSIRPTFSQLINVFGETCDQISKTALESVSIDARFPSHFDITKVKGTARACSLAPGSSGSRTIPGPTPP